GSISSTFLRGFLAVRVFFIISTLPFGRLASTNESNRAGTLGKTDQQQAILVRIADDNFALLLLGVNLIVENCSKWVGKNCGCFLKGHLVLLLVGSGLICVPFKFQAHLLSYEIRGCPLFPCVANGHRPELVEVMKYICIHPRPIVKRHDLY